MLQPVFTVMATFRFSDSPSPFGQHKMQVFWLVLNTITFPILISGFSTGVSIISIVSITRRTDSFINALTAAGPHGIFTRFPLSCDTVAEHQCSYYSMLHNYDNTLKQGCQAPKQYFLGKFTVIICVLHMRGLHPGHILYPCPARRCSFSRLFFRLWLRQTRFAPKSSLSLFPVLC